MQSYVLRFSASYEKQAVMCPCHSCRVRVTNLSSKSRVRVI